MTPVEIVNFARIVADNVEQEIRIRMSQHKRSELGGMQTQDEIDINFLLQTIDELRKYIEDLS